MNTKGEGLLHWDSNKEIISNHHFNIQDLWDTIKRSNYGLKEGTEMQSKGKENVFNEIIAKMFPYLEREIGTQEQKSLRAPNIHDQKIS